MKRKFIFLLILLACSFAGNSQIEFHDYPVIGKACPQFFLKNISYWSKTTASVNSLKGKPFILDFFNAHCAACFASFPKLNALYNKHKNDFNLILVGLEDKEIRPVYEKFRIKMNLELPVSYSGDSLCLRFTQSLYPTLVWVDKNGIVKAVTTSESLNEQNLSDFIADRRLAVEDKSYETVRSRNQNYNPRLPFLIYGNGGIDTNFLFRSVIARYDKSSVGQHEKPLLESMREGNKVQLTGLTKAMLYNYAFLGKATWTWGDTLLYENYYTWPFFEGIDSSEIRYDFKQAVIESDNNIFSYSLIYPDTIQRPSRIKSIMQSDLRNFFNYDAKIEERVIPCWQLIVSQKALDELKTKGGNPTFKGGLNGVSMINEPVNFLLAFIRNPLLFKEIIIYNGSFPDKIDITLNCDMTDIIAVKKELQKNGLDLIKIERKMKVIVVTPTGNRI